MEFRHLRYFIAVAEELNFTRAAVRLRISQPPLSRQIQQLEEEVGVQLLTRDRRQVLLTSAGQTFLEEARKLIEQAEHALNAVRPAADQKTAIVRVGIGAGLGEKISAVFTAHAQRYPAVEIQCKDILSTLQNEALREHTIDVGFLRPPVDSRRLLSELLYKEPIMVLVAKTNPLARAKALRMSELANETLLLHERHVSSGIYDKVLDIYRKANVNPTIVHTQTGPYEEAGTMLVAAGRGIFLVSGSLTHRAFGKEVTTIPLLEPGAVFQVHVAWRKGEKSAAVLNLLNSVRNAFKPAMVKPAPLNSRPLRS